MRGLSGLLTVSASMIHLSYMKNEQQSITLNDLARMINGSFDDVTKEFEKVNARFDRVETRLDALEAGQNRILSVLDNKVFRAEHDLLERRVKVLEEKVGVSSSVV